MFNNFFTKIAKKDYNNRLEEILSQKNFSEEAKRTKVNESKIKREIRKDFSPIMKVQTKPFINLQWLFNLLYQSRFN